MCGNAPAQKPRCPHCLGPFLYLKGRWSIPFVCSTDIDLGTLMTRSRSVLPLQTWNLGRGTPSLCPPSVSLRHMRTRSGGVSTGRSSPPCFASSLPPRPRSDRRADRPPPCHSAPRLRAVLSRPSPCPLLGPRAARLPGVGTPVGGILTHRHPPVPTGRGWLGCGWQPRHIFCTDSGWLGEAPTPVTHTHTHTSSVGHSAHTVSCSRKTTDMPPQTAS